MKNSAASDVGESRDCARRARLIAVARDDRRIRSPARPCLSGIVSLVYFKAKPEEAKHMGSTVAFLKSQLLRPGVCFVLGFLLLRNPT